MYVIIEHAPRHSELLRNSMKLYAQLTHNQSNVIFALDTLYKARIINYL